MTSETAATLVSFGTFLAVMGIAFLGQLGFAYWWPTIWIVGPVGIALSFWLGVRSDRGKKRTAAVRTLTEQGHEVGRNSHRKVAAAIALVAFGCIGWFVPLASHDAPTTIGFSIAPFFRSAGVTLWRVAPFGFALGVLGISARRRR